jgi:hypothetical protein
MRMDHPMHHAVEPQPRAISATVSMCVWSDISNQLPLLYTLDLINPIGACAEAKGGQPRGAAA